MPNIIRTCEPLHCCDERWENAYLRFESPRQEIHKFKSRLRRLGASEWSRDLQVLEIFCGRGNGLSALSELGFHNLQGADLSERLLQQFKGEAQLYVADCRKLPFDDQSKDIVIVQGGLHHLPCIPDDLVETVSEVRRVLRPNGLFVIVEPWWTPFLNWVQFLSGFRTVRRLSSKFDAFAILVQQEAGTYYRWLAMPDVVLRVINASFVQKHQRKAWGKLEYIGSPKS